MQIPLTMRIGIILAQKLGQTGSGTFSINLAQGLRHCGHDVSLLAAGPLPDSIQHLDLKITTVPFGDGGGPSFPVPGMSDVMPYESSVFSQLTLSQIREYLSYWENCILNFLGLDFDVIHVNHWWLVASIVIRLAKIPVVITIHGTDLEQWLQCQHLVEAVNLNLIRPHCFHAVSSRVKKQAMEIGVSSAENSVIIPPPYREDIFNLNSRNSSSRKGSLFVGKLSEQKGIVELLTAFREVKSRFKDAHLKLIGSSPNSNQWEQLAYDFGIDKDLQFRGFLEQSELAEEYRNAEVVVIPSWHEGYSLVAVEAASCGATIVIPRYGAADELLRECLPPTRLRLVDTLLNSSEPSRKDFSRRLANVWNDALSSKPTTLSFASSDCLYRKASRPAVAEQMIDLIYGPLLSHRTTLAN